LPCMATGSISCCDAVTKACFLSAASMCPDQGTGGADAGSGGTY
jgi:hypothetical protein